MCISGDLRKYRCISALLGASRTSRTSRPFRASRPSRASRASRASRSSRPSRLFSPHVNGIGPTAGRSRSGHERPRPFWRRRGTRGSAPPTRAASTTAPVDGQHGTRSPLLLRERSRAVREWPVGPPSGFGSTGPIARVAIDPRRGAVPILCARRAHSPVDGQRALHRRLRLGAQTWAHTGLNKFAPICRRR
jgi:hypothetical protein